MSITLSTDKSFPHLHLFIRRKHKKTPPRAPGNRGAYHMGGYHPPAEKPSPLGQGLRSAPSGRNSEQGLAPRSKISRRMPPKFLETARGNVCGSKRQGATQVSLAGTTVSFRRKRWGYIFFIAPQGGASQTTPTVCSRKRFLLRFPKISAACALKEEKSPLRQAACISA